MEIHQDLAGPLHMGERNPFFSSLSYSDVYPSAFGKIVMLLTAILPVNNLSYLTIQYT
jgi:hypothetical protein